MIKRIDLEIIDKLSQEALASPRLRKNMNYHEVLSDTLQRLLNAMEPGTYVQPHKHENPDKREVFVLLRGKVVVVTFNNNGSIQEYSILDPKNGKYGVEIPAGTWHTIIVLEPKSVVFETKDGPYSPIDDKNFATWAPAEGAEGCTEYNNSILSLAGIKA
jgi:cupin fold WbuC family metalloprotein